MLSSPREEDECLDLTVFRREVGRTCWREGRESHGYGLKYISSTGSRSSALVTEPFTDKDDWIMIIGVQCNTVEGIPKSTDGSIQPYGNIETVWVRQALYQTVKYEME